LSQTAAASEWLVGLAPGSQARDPFRTVFETPRLDAPEDFDSFVQTCTILDITKALLSIQGKGREWWGGELGLSLYNHNVRVNGHTCTNGGGYQIGAWTAGSNHPGGANTLFCDGHVSFVRERIALPVWQAIGSINGGELVSLTEF
jgi:prepilin-type processing-associated H-X9-DG protein